MKSGLKKIVISLAVIIIAGLVLYKGVYSKVYNQSNTQQDTVIGANVGELSPERVVNDMYDLPNRFAGTKSNARAVQYVRNFFREIGLEPYEGDTYYHSFYGEYLKCSRFFMLQVNGTVENVAGMIKGIDSTKAVVVSAHLDSFLGKGVVDNASGVAALLNTAKILSRDLQSGSYPVDIIFVSFNAEESGLLGSQALYEDMSQRYTEFYNINMDCVGVKDKALAMKNEFPNSEKLYKEFLPFLDKYNIPYENIVYAADEDGDAVGNSDNLVFQENGRAAIVLGETQLVGFTNTRKDKDLTLMDYKELVRLTNAVADFIISSDGRIY